MLMKETSITVLNYLKKHAGENMTAADVAEALDMKASSVNGIFTMVFQKNDLGVRVPATIELEDGSIKEVKFLALTDAGMNCTPELKAE